MKEKGIVSLSVNSLVFFSGYKKYIYMKMHLIKR